MDKFIAELKIYYTWRYWFLVIYLIHITYATANKSATYKKEYGVTWVEATKFAVLKQVKFHLLFFPMWFFFIFTEQGRKKCKKILKKLDEVNNKSNSIEETIVFVGVGAVICWIMSLSIIYVGVYKYR
ncbi:MAG: hypothetical protein RR191_05465 [Cetobacterium sp.]